MIDFVIPGFVLRYSVLGIYLSFQPGGRGSHLFSVASNADVLSGEAEHITRVSFGSGRIGLGY